MQRSRIVGTGTYLPERVVTNDDLSKNMGIDTSDAWIRERTGIGSRRIAGPNEATSDMASAASKRALEMAGGRLLDRASRGQHADVPKFRIHTRIRPRDRDHAGELLTGAWAHLAQLAAHVNVPENDLEYVLREYCTELLLRGVEHRPELLRVVLERAAQ